VWDGTSPLAPTKIKSSSEYESEKETSTGTALLSYTFSSSTLL